MKMARTLDVYLKRDLVGRLEQDDAGAMRFAYAAAWLSAKSAVPLSHSLPLRSARFTRKECRPFFAGLLPEENSRKLVAQAFGVSDKNDFAILEKIGGECAGAVSLMPPGALPAGEDGIRLSLAGAQGKLVVAIQKGDFYLPLDGSPSSHILKPKSAHFDGLVENEFFCMRLAATVGLEVAAVEIGTAGDIQFLQEGRFDRTRQPDGQLDRMHQEDFCQALGIPPEIKYQQEGGPSLKTCFELVRSVSAVPGLDILRLFDAVVFNFLIGNSDAHGKNFSFLYYGRHSKLAPLYDLVCTQAFPTLSPEMAMKIGNERKPGRVVPASWQRLFKDAGLGQAPARRRLLELVDRVLEETQAMAGMDVAGATQVSPIIVSNCQRLQSQVWHGE
jgi:serine/threonine-protein kinase HipA